MNNVQPVGGWWDDLTSGVSDFFTGGSSTGSTSDYTPYNPTPVTTSDPFGFDLSFSPFTKPYSTPDLGTYLNTGWLGSSGSTSTSTTSGTDLFSGISDFISGATSSLKDLFGTGLSAYAEVQKLINSQNPTDVIVNRPELGGAVVQRTQNGSVTYLPLVTAYPQFAGQIQTAKKSDTTNALLIAGVLGLGLVLILKKK